MASSTINPILGRAVPFAVAGPRFQFTQSVAGHGDFEERRSRFRSFSPDGLFSSRGPHCAHGAQSAPGSVCKYLLDADRRGAVDRVIAAVTTNRITNSWEVHQSQGQARRGRCHRRVPGRCPGSDLNCSFRRGSRSSHASLPAGCPGWHKSRGRQLAVPRNPSEPARVFQLPVPPDRRVPACG